MELEGSSSKLLLKPAGYDSSDDEDLQGFDFGGSDTPRNEGSSNTTVTNGETQGTGGGGFGKPHSRNTPRLSPFNSNASITATTNGEHTVTKTKYRPIQAKSHNMHKAAGNGGHQTGSKNVEAHHAHGSSVQDWAKPDQILIDDFRMAVLRNNIQAVKDFLHQGLAVDTVFSSGWTALMYAANYAQPEIVQLLLDNGADPNFHKDLFTVSMSACSSNSQNEKEIVQCVELLLNKGAEVNTFDRHHQNPLIYATRKGRTMVVDRLLDASVHIDKQDNKGNTALMWAATLGHIRVTHTLLERGADTSKQRCDGARALDIAFVQGHKQAEEMIRAKENPSSDSTPSMSVPPEESATANTPDSQQSMRTIRGDSANEVHTYGDLELFLTGLELASLIPVFLEKKIQFQDFLRMTDKDFIQLGITQMGARKKMIDAIDKTHKKPWETTSLNPVHYNKQISCAEAVAMVANVKKHAAYISSTIGHITDQIKEKEEILFLAQEHEGQEELRIQTEEALTNVKYLYEELSLLREHLSKVAKFEQYMPADLISSKPKQTQSKLHRYLSTKHILAGAAICGLLYYTRSAIWQGLSSVRDKIQNPNR